MTHPGARVAILIAILLVNLSILYTSLRRPGSFFSKQDADRTVPTMFSQNQAFQSLDHKYDDIWAALSLNKTNGGVINRSDGLGREQGAISM